MNVVSVFIGFGNPGHSESERCKTENRSIIKIVSYKQQFSTLET